MHGYSAGIRDGVENGAHNYASLGQYHVCPRGKEVPRDAVRYGKRSHAGIPHVPHDIQYCCRRGGESNVGGSMWPPGGTAWDGVGGGREQPDILRGRWEDWWKGPHLGTRRPDGVSCDVPTYGTGDEPGEEKGPGVHPQVHLGEVE